MTLKHIRARLARRLWWPALGRGRRRPDETEYLLSSPENARRLRAAVAASRRGEGVTLTLDELRERATRAPQEAPQPQEA